MNKPPIDDAAIAQARKVLACLQEMRATEDKYKLSVNTYYGEVEVSNCNGAFEYDEDFSFFVFRGEDVKQDQYWVKKSDSGHYILCNIPHPDHPIYGTEPHDAVML